LAQGSSAPPSFPQRTGTMDKAKAQKIIDDGAAKIKALEAEMEALTGKDNKKARNAKSREVADLKKEPDYVDAERVLAGKEPLQDKNKSGAGGEEKVDEFANIDMSKVKGAGAAGGGSPKRGEEKPKEAPKEKTEEEKKKEEEKKAKKEEKAAAASAGISPAERKELEDLKQQIITKKAALKAEGMSGGQQNKDPEVVKMVTRMNELKEKENPGSTSPKKDKGKEDKKKKGNPEEIEKLKQEIEEYKTKLKTEFGYTNKDIQKDEDIVEMTKRLKAMGV